MHLHTHPAVSCTSTIKMISKEFGAKITDSNKSDDWLELSDIILEQLGVLLINFLFPEDDVLLGTSESVILEQLGIFLVNFWFPEYNEVLGKSESANV